jgi:hypothetical protein
MASFGGVLISAGGCHQHASARSNVHLTELGQAEGCAERLCGEEADVVGAGVEVGFERLAAQADLQALQRAVVGGRYEEQAMGFQDSVDLGEQAEDVLDVLEDLTRPDDVEDAVRKREFLPTLHELESRMALSRKADGFTGHIATRRPRTMLDQRGGEVAQPAPQVENARPRRHVSKEEVAPEHEVLR